VLLGGLWVWGLKVEPQRAGMAASSTALSSGGSASVVGTTAESSESSGEETGDEVDESTGSVEEPEPAPTLAPTPSPKRNGAARPGCPEVVAEARDASQARRWSRVLSRTRSSRCWDDRTERALLRIEALSELQRYADCFALGKSSPNAEVRRMAKICGSQLNEEKSP